ncbi:hypothetical protein [Cytobacillus dafuensis]|uniref:SHOCT domain-containing protein n=1 Tax=Cytobacillus dafuensis TaxID=1742359 RepID=A0A5B8Z7D8_CYTDA|nr:hypothetical protein [Cytobacillus dafuensis]QED49035.1 hypothetical protein FSZ17_18140 [Cytobacillus dafuensis]
MKKIILSWIWIAFLVLSFPRNFFAETQNPILKLEELNIQVMPEYALHPKDKEKSTPSLLIGYHGTLKNTTENPQKGQIEIPLPVNEKNFRIGFVADYNRDLSEMNEIDYKIDKKAGIISWETSEDIQPQEAYKFVIEYYSDQIKTDEDKKSLSYHFKSFTDIGLVSVIFLEPLKTENFTLTPAADSHQENGYGMNMFLYQYQGMKLNEEKEFKLEYNRSEAKTTIELMEEMAGNSPHGEGAVKKNETLPIGVTISVVGGISILSAILLVIFFKKRKKKPNVKKNETNKVNEFELKKSRLRTMLLEGSITEEEYKELLKKIGG